MSRKDVLSKIYPIIETKAVELGLILVDAEFSKEGGRWFLRIYIHNEKKPITHEDCERLTIGLSDYLDEIIDVPYYLEVSSPGLERKLKTDREFKIFKGKKVKAELKNKIERFGREIKGILGDKTDKEIKIKPFDSQEEIAINTDNISKIRLDLIQEEKK